ncbi:MAG: hypothetical protein ACP5XB_20430 [Isosphaeraceae bacterium]
MTFHDRESRQEAKALQYESLGRVGLKVTRFLKNSSGSVGQD